MPFIQKKFVFDETIEIEKFYTPRFNIKGEKRRAKYQPTAEQVQKHNKKQAEKRLRRLIKANFKRGDWHITLTYDKDNRPDVEQAHRNLNNYIKAIRRYCNKHGYIFQYIHVTEYLNTAIHHHMIIKSFENIQEVCIKKWKHNTNWTPLYEAECVEVLAEYLIKETDKTFRDDPCVRQRYSSSKNLVRPEPEVRICSSHIAKEPQVPKEYRNDYVIDVDHYYFGVSEKTGYASQSIILRKMTKTEKCEKQKRKKIRHRRRRLDE